MPNTRANVEVLISHLHVMTFGSLVVIARHAHRAVALHHGDPAARLGVRHPHGVLHRAPFAREVRDGDAARAALVHAPDAVARFRDGQQRRGRVHQPPFTCSSFFTAVTPLTFLATPSARCLVSSESTRPLGVTTPLPLSTLVLRSGFGPPFFAGAGCTLLGSAGPPA